jgi:hypothetical protein
MREANPETEDDIPSLSVSAPTPEEENARLRQENARLEDALREEATASGDMADELQAAQSAAVNSRYLQQQAHDDEIARRDSEHERQLADQRDVYHQSLDNNRAVMALASATATSTPADLSGGHRTADRNNIPDTPVATTNGTTPDLGPPPPAPPVPPPLSSLQGGMRGYGGRLPDIQQLRYVSRARAPLAETARAHDTTATTSAFAGMTLAQIPHSTDSYRVPPPLPPTILQQIRTHQAPASVRKYALLDISADLEDLRLTNPFSGDPVRYRCFRTSCVPSSTPSIS